LDIIFTIHQKVKHDLPLLNPSPIILSLHPIHCLQCQKCISIAL